MTEYRNPVIPGFYPDPSVCRVGGDYYLVTSSCEYFPGIPIFHSRDLVHWRQIGHCLTRLSQLPLEGAECSGGIWAPTIRWHEGTFYVASTNMRAGGNFYVTATDPAGEWSDLIPVRMDGIDPSLTFDEGRAYFCTNQSAADGTPGISQAEIDIATGELLSPVRFLWAGTGGRAPEAPHLYRIGDWYYLMIAEGGTQFTHMVTVARSKSLWGPFEGCPRNPVLTNVNTRWAGRFTAAATAIWCRTAVGTGGWCIWASALRAST
jgi:alpha-N-arabinofuranosidase